MAAPKYTPQLIFFAICVIVLIFFLNRQRNELNTLKTKVKTLTIQIPSPCQEYRQQCFTLYKKLRYPDKKYLFNNPPSKDIPKELMDNFTQHGDMPLTKYWYFNDAYNDAFSNDKKKKTPTNVANFNMYRDKVRKWEPLGYGDKSFHVLMDGYKSLITDRSIVVIGTISPWIEAISYEMNASKIVTLDYTRKYWHEKKLEWFHVNDYLEEMIASRTLEQYDNAATFSSIEHAGLGRFGDPLSPDGDLDVMKQVHCMLKPGSLFFVGGLENTVKEKGELQFNAQRIYGSKRLKLLFEGWEILKRNGGEFVIKKKGGCDY